MWLLIFLISLPSVIYARPDASFINTNGYQRRNQIEHLVQSPMVQDLPGVERTMEFQSNFGNQAVQHGTDIEPQFLVEPPHIHSAYPSSGAYMQDSYQTAYYHSGIPHETGYAPSMPKTQVHKHVYVHVPPKDFEEEDAIQPHVYHQNAPKQKHYKIVFIKTPMPPPVRPAMVAPPPQNEEKTLIYVLHKKPDTQQDIVIPAAPPTTPSKPEVFFIKYKAKKEGAPVYGPPPVDSEPRYSGAAAALEASTSVDPMGIDNPTTLQPEMENQSATQKPSLSELYLPPTMATHEEGSDDLISNSMPLARYGPPNHFFYKH